MTAEEIKERIGAWRSSPAYRHFTLSSALRAMLQKFDRTSPPIGDNPDRVVLWAETEPHRFRITIERIS